MGAAVPMPAGMSAQLHGPNTPTPPSPRKGIPSDFSRISYIGGYLGFAFGYVILVTLRTIANLASSLTASRLIHERSLLSLDRSPVTFFDTTPVGRILNRFSKVTRSGRSTWALLAAHGMGWDRVGES